MDIELLLSIHRHWVWADRMRELFGFYLKKEWPIPEGHFGRGQPYMLSSIFTCMCLWYGLLYVTCEGIKKSGDADINEIAPDYANVKSTLRRFRNAVFHVQTKYWSSKLTDVLDDQPIVDSIHEIHNRIGSWLEQQFKPFEKKASPKNKE